MSKRSHVVFEQDRKHLKLKYVLRLVADKLWQFFNKK